MPLLAVNLEETKKVVNLTRHERFMGLIKSHFFFTYIPVLLLRTTTPMHVVASSVPTNYIDAKNILSHI
jgi:hypothetical protein